MKLHPLLRNHILLCRDGVCGCLLGKIKRDFFNYNSDIFTLLVCQFTMHRINDPPNIQTSHNFCVFFTSYIHVDHYVIFERSFSRGGV